MLTTKNSTELKIGTAGWEQKKRKRNFSPTKIYETGHKRLQEVKPKAHILPRQLPLELQRKTAESSKRKTGSPPSSKNSGAKTDHLLQKTSAVAGSIAKESTTWNAPTGTLPQAPVPQ